MKKFRISLGVGGTIIETHTVQARNYESAWHMAYKWATEDAGYNYIGVKMIDD